MTKEIKITLPKLGESIVSATVVQILKKEGDFIAKDEALLEVATDKVNSEIPSTVSGMILHLNVKVGEEIYLGQELAIVATEEDEEAKKETSSNETEGSLSEKDTGNLLSPAVLHLAKQHNITIDELHQITPSGQSGRLSKKDVENYVSQKTSQGSAREKKITLSPLRKTIAQNVSRSFYEAPHASVWMEVDVTDLVQFIEKEKQQFFEKTQVKLTITSYIAQAICHAVKQYPLLNSTLSDDVLTVKQYVNLGIAANTEDGVIVFVMKDCENKSTTEVAREIYHYAKKAKENRLELKDTQNGTITFTNYGMTGALMGTPIIRYPEAAIIGSGAIIKRWVVDEKKNTGVIRSMIMISVTFDHRIVDGVYACGFLQEIKKELEKQPRL